MGRGQELLNAAREGDKRTVEKILGQITNISGPFTSLRRGAGVNVQDDNGYTPLHQACLNGHKEIVRVLLLVGASPCIVDKKGATPLHLAAFNGDTDVCWMLLAHNNPPVNIDQLTSDHETALLIAAQFGFVNVVAQLITRGADVTIKNNNDESALDLAAQYGRLATVQHLLQVRPHLVDQYRHPTCRGVVFTSTPLHRASKNGRKDVVTALIDAGMDPNVRTHSGTPLHEAARFGKPSVVRILLNKGADLHAQDSRRKTVYDLLAEYPEEATRKVRKVIRDHYQLSCNRRATLSNKELSLSEDDPLQTEYENIVGTFDSDKELPPFPVQDYSPDAAMNYYSKSPTAKKLSIKSNASNTFDDHKNNVNNAINKLPPPESNGSLKNSTNSSLNVDMRERSESFVLKQLKILGNAIKCDTSCTELLENQNQVISEMKSRNKSKAGPDSEKEVSSLQPEDLYDNLIPPSPTKELGEKMRRSTMDKSYKNVLTGIDDSTTLKKKPHPSPRPETHVSKFIPPPAEDHTDSIYVNECIAKRNDYDNDNIYENLSQNLPDDEKAKTELFVNKHNHSTDMYIPMTGNIPFSTSTSETYDNPLENRNNICENAEVNADLSYVTMTPSKQCQKRMSNPDYVSCGHKTDLVHLRGDIGCLYGSLDYLYIYEINPRTIRGNSHPFTKTKQKANPMPCYCHEDPDRDVKIKRKMNGRGLGGSQLVYYSCEEIYVPMQNKEDIYASLNDLSIKRIKDGENAKCIVDNIADNDGKVLVKFDDDHELDDLYQDKAATLDSKMSKIIKKKVIQVKQFITDW